jgi:hypothetical protein
MQNRYDFGTRQPPQYIKDIAEHMYKRGLQLLPQSPYLMLQFLSYTVAYPADVSALNSADFSFDRIEENFASEISVFEAWLLFRRRRDLQVAKRRQVASNDEIVAVETMGHVEGAKLIHTARESTFKYRSVIRSIWKQLLMARRHAEAAQQSESRSITRLTVLIEKAWDYEDAASKAYKSLLVRMDSTRSEDLITSTLNGYLHFLQHVKVDVALAAEVRDRTEQFRLVSGSASAGSDSAAHVSKLSQLEGLILDDHVINFANEQLKFKLRIVTGIMAVVSTVLFFTFFALIGRYQETLMSLVESGYRRSYVHEISTGTMPRTHDVRLSVTGRLWHGSWPRGAQTARLIHGTLAAVPLLLMRAHPNRHGRYVLFACIQVCEGCTLLR